MRRLFTLASALSLLLFGLFMAAWIRAGLTTDVFVEASGGRCVVVWTWDQGVLWEEYLNWPYTEPPTWRHGRGLAPAMFVAWGTPYVSLALDRQNHLAIAPLVYGEYHHSGSVRRRVVHYFQLSNWIRITTILPVAWVSVAFWKAAKRNRYRLHDRCVSCGYDLTGNTSGVCPECGTAVVRKIA